VPTLENFRSCAPFDIDELADAAARLLRARPADRTRRKDGAKSDDEISPRTIRYYISQGLLPGHRGSPKHARYGFEHLVGVVAIRAYQDLGHRLEQVSGVRALLASVEGTRELAEFAERWLVATSVADVSPPDLSARANPLSVEGAVVASGRPRDALRLTGAALLPECEPMSRWMLSGRVKVESVVRIRLTSSVTLEVKSGPDEATDLELACDRLTEMVKGRSRATGV